MIPPLNLKVLLLALVYFVAGWYGLKLPYTGSFITLVWLPTGIAVAALLRWGWMMWPGVFMGAFLVNFAIGSSAPLAMEIAVGNTLGPLLTAWWLRRAGFHIGFDRQVDVGNFILAAVLGMLVSSSGGVASLYFSGILPLSSAGFAWLTWWMGDSVGVLLAAPILLTLTRKNIDRLFKTPREGLLLLIVGAVVVWFAFLQDYEKLGRTLPLAFMSLPLVAIAALRFGITGGSLSALVLSVIAAWSTVMGRGTFFLPDTQISLLLLWAYMTTCVLTGLLITTLLAERFRAERTLQESEEKLRGLYELAPLGIALTDMQGRLLEFNKAYQHITGYPLDELLKLDYWKLTPQKYNEDEEKQLESLGRTGFYGPYEKEYIRKDGSAVDVRLNGMLVSGKEDQKYIWSIVEDISDRKRSEQELIQAKFQAESANHAKSAFLATMSHEIRTPMNAILGMAQLLMMPGLSEEERLEFTKTLNKSGEHLLELLNDILDLSKVESGKLELRYAPFDPQQMAAEVSALFAEHVRSKGLRIEVAWHGPTGREYEGDALRLRQMLSNLISNAIKFTASGFVRLDVRELSRDGDDVKLEFAVTDTGIGIPADKQARLFKPFSQVDNTTTREYGGTGLGLSIIRGLAEIMGGEVGVRSEAGQGSRFWFTILTKVV